MESKTKENYQTWTKTLKKKTWKTWKTWMSSGSYGTKQPKTDDCQQKDHQYEQSRFQATVQEQVGFHPPDEYEDCFAKPFLSQSLKT
jgi:hypothetical protein